MTIPAVGGVSSTHVDLEHAVVAHDPSITTDDCFDDVKPHAFEDAKKPIELITTGGKKSSVLMAAANIALAAIGLGVIMLPLVMARAGWIGGVIMIIVAGFAANFMSKRLYDCSNMHPDRSTARAMTTFEEVGSVAFGRWGGVYAGAAVHVTMLGVCSILILLLGENTYKVASSAMGQTAWTVAWAMVLLPLTWLRSFAEVGQVSYIGLGSILCLVCIILVAGANKAIANHNAPDQVIAPSYAMWPSDLWSLMTAFGTTVLSQNVANCVITISKDMKVPTDFPKACNISYMAIGAAYLAIASAGYAGWGEELTTNKSISNILDAISPKPEKGESQSFAQLGVLGSMTVFCIIVTAVPHFLVEFLPIAVSAEETLENIRRRMYTKKAVKSIVAGDGEYTTAVPLEVSPSHERIRRITIRSCLVLLSLAVALVVPRVDKIVDLMGALTMAQIVFILPAIFYWRLLRLNDKPVQSKKNVGEFLAVAACLVTGVTILIVGGTASIGEMFASESFGG